MDLFVRFLSEAAELILRIFQIKCENFSPGSPRRAASSPLREDSSWLFPAFTLTGNITSHKVVVIDSSDIR
jgi:hypothetical protein